MAETVLVKLVIDKQHSNLFNKYKLADTVRGKKLSANWKCPTFGKFFNIGLNFENKAFFYIYKV